MKKILRIIKKNIRILFKYALFILIILSVSIFVEAQEIENVPGSYGYYFLKKGEWVKIPEIVTTLRTPLKGVFSTWGILGIDSKPEIIIEEQYPTFLIYDKDTNTNKLQLVRLWYFEKLRAVDFHGTPPDPGSFKKLCGVERNSLQDFKKWTVVGTYPIIGRLILNHPDMFRVRPKKNLPPGVYAIYQGTKFTSLPLSSDLGIPLRAFEIKGAEKEPPELTCVDNPRVKIINSCISDRLEGIENMRVKKYNFLVSEKQIICYIGIKGQRSGEIAKFIWYRPDGTIQVRHKYVLGLAQPGKIFYVHQKYNPSNLLMPGKWILAVEIYGERVKCMPFYISTS